METVVLIHGLWMKAPVMWPLARRLSVCGYRTRRFNYHTTRASLSESAKALQAYLQRLDADTVHLVGHSMGGLLIRQLFHDFPEQHPGRVVTLGTPHQGSQVARQVQQVSLGRRLLGDSLENCLLGDVPPWQGGRELGGIAGTCNVGMGYVVGGLADSDGVVAREETHVSHETDYRLLPVSHTFMLLSRRVATQVCSFLKTGKFDEVLPGESL